jgi:hypothetical protein
MNAEEAHTVYGWEDVTVCYRAPGIIRYPLPPRQAAEASKPRLMPALP